MYQHVKVRICRNGAEKRIHAIIVQRKGTNSYIVRVLRNNKLFVHANHLIHNDSEMFSSKIVDFVPKEASLVHVPPAVTDAPSQDNIPSNIPEAENEENVEIDPDYKG